MKKRLMRLGLWSRPIIFLAFLAALLSGCGSAIEPTERFTLPTKNSPTVSTGTPALTPTVPTQTPTIAQTKTKQAEPTYTPTEIVVTNWGTFSHPIGLSLEYPTDWKVDVYNDDVWIQILFNGKRYVEIYPRPIDEQDFEDPHTWQPNEGGYEIQWEKLIVVDGAEGYEFVWGFDDGAVLLFGDIYSKEYSWLFVLVLF